AYSALCLVGALLYLRFMQEPPRRSMAGEERAGGASDKASDTPGVRPPGGVRARAREVAALLRLPGFAVVLALNFVFFWLVAGGYDTMVPLFAREGLGVSTIGVGALFGITILTELTVL